MWEWIEQTFLYENNGPVRSETAIAKWLADLERGGREVLSLHLATIESNTPDRYAAILAVAKVRILEDREAKK
jgi:hypothetical protein